MMFHFVVTVLAIENDWVFLSFFVFFCFHAFHVSCFHVVEKKKEKRVLCTDGWGVTVEPAYRCGLLGSPHRG